MTQLDNDPTGVTDNENVTCHGSCMKDVSNRIGRGEPGGGGREEKKKEISY